MIDTEGKIHRRCPADQAWSSTLKSKEDWAKSGLLEGLSNENQDKLIVLYNQIDYSKLGVLDEHYEIETYILPVIRRIFSILVCDETVNKAVEKHSVFKTTFSDVAPEEVFKLINVKEITGLLYVYSRGLIPMAEIFLPDLDAQAESVSLFCDNYVMKLIDRVRRTELKQF